MSGETIFMDAVLRPNRSMSDRAVRIVLIIALVASVAWSVYFLQVGAIPVAGFFGLDVLALYLAFRVNRRMQAQETRVRVTQAHVDLDHTDGRGNSRTARLPTAFVRVELDEPVRPNTSVRLCLSDKSYVVGRFLTPEERREFAEALRGAIQRARTGLV